MKDNNLIKNFIAFNVLLTYTDNHGQLHLWIDQHKHWHTNQCSSSLGNQNHSTDTAAQ